VLVGVATRFVHRLIVAAALAGCLAAGRAAAEPNEPAEPAPAEASSKETAPSSAAVGEEPPTVASLTETICPAIGREASLNALPVEFFTRLIWQESRFNPRARSHKGAEGIAQFMPGTARWRGLINSYEPVEALRESARWLGELREQFGNLGLAAAAYNAGPGRVRSWIAGQGGLPAETRHYVRVITGRTVDEWRAAEEDDIAPALKNIPCAQIAKLFMQPPRQRGRPAPPADPIDPEAWGPWGLQLAGNWTTQAVLEQYRRMQSRYPSVLGDRKPMIMRSNTRSRGRATWYLLRVAEATREKADTLCSKLKSAGGACIVYRNGPDQK
jgi:hypothetical protein